MPDSTVLPCPVPPLTQALREAREANSLPAQHAIMRTVLMVARTVQQGNATQAPPPLPPPVPTGKGGLLDFFLVPPPAPAEAPVLYQEELKSLGHAVNTSGE
jgi:hypothetical protein